MIVASLYLPNGNPVPGPKFTYKMAYCPPAAGAAGVHVLGLPAQPLARRNAGLRIDHLLLSKSLKRRLAAAGIDRAVRGVGEPPSILPFATCLAAVRHTVAEALRRRKERSMARLEGRAFEHLDDRTLRDLGFHRIDAGVIGRHATGCAASSLRRVIHAM